MTRIFFFIDTQTAANIHHSAVALRCQLFRNQIRKMQEINVRYKKTKEEENQTTHSSNRFSNTRLS